MPTFRLLLRKARPYYTDSKWQHVQDVLRTAKLIKKKRLSAVLNAAILWHDTAKRDMGDYLHALNGSHIALKDLAQLYTPLQLKTISDAIKEHSIQLRVLDLKTMEQNIPYFSSPLALLLAMADDVRPADLDKIWNKQLKYTYLHTPLRTPLDLYKHMTTFMDPFKRLPELKYYKQPFTLISSPFINWLHSIDVDTVRKKMQEYKRQREGK